MRQRASGRRSIEAEGLLVAQKGSQPPNRFSPGRLNTHLGPQAVIKMHFKKKDAEGDSEAVQSVYSPKFKRLL